MDDPVVEQPAAGAEPPVEIKSSRGLRITLGIIGLVIFGGSFVLLVWGDDLLRAATAWRFAVMPPAAAYPPPKDQAEANRQDLDYLGHFAELDASLTGDSRAAFQQDREALLARAATLSKAQFDLGVARAVAHAGNADSNADPAGQADRFNRLPVKLEWFPEGLFVVAAQQSAASLLGSRIESIDGKPVTELAAGYRPYRGGGTDAATRLASTWLLQSPEALNAVWPEMSAGEAVLHVVAADGKEDDVTLTAIDAATAARAEDWRDLLGTRLPLVLQEPGRAVFGKALSDGIYLRLGRLEPDAKGPVARQISALLDPFAPGSRNWIVLDLRRSDGGDPLSAIGLRDLPGHVSSAGRIYVLTSPRTGSAALEVAAWVKVAGGDRTIIEGEPAGERAQFWSEEGAPLVLPNSGLRVDFSTAYHDLQNGCRSLACYWPDVVHGAPAGSLAPRVVKPWQFEDYRQSVDTLLQRLADLTRVPDLAGHTK
jgi:hypothetical protein